MTLLLKGGGVSVAYPGMPGGVHGFPLQDTPALDSHNVFHINPETGMPYEGTTEHMWPIQAAAAKIARDIRKSNPEMPYTSALQIAMKTINDSTEDHNRDGFDDDASRMEHQLELPFMQMGDGSFVFSQIHPDYRTNVTSDYQVSGQQRNQPTHNEHGMVNVWTGVSDQYGIHPESSAFHQRASVVPRLREQGFNTAADTWDLDAGGTSHIEPGMQVQYLDGQGNLRAYLKRRRGRASQQRSTHPETDFKRDTKEYDEVTPHNIIHELPDSFFEVDARRGGGVVQRTLTEMGYPSHQANLMSRTAYGQMVIEGGRAGPAGKGKPRPHAMVNKLLESLDAQPGGSMHARFNEHLSHLPSGESPSNVSQKNAARKAMAAVILGRELGHDFSVSGGEDMREAWGDYVESVAPPDEPFVMPEIMAEGMHESMAPSMTGAHHVGDVPHHVPYAPMETVERPPIQHMRDPSMAPPPRAAAPPPRRVGVAPPVSAPPPARMPPSPPPMAPPPPAQMPVQQPQMPVQQPQMPVQQPQVPEQQASSALPRILSPLPRILPQRAAPQRGRLSRIFRRSEDNPQYCLTEMMDRLQVMDAKMDDTIMKQARPLLGSDIETLAVSLSIDPIDVRDIVAHGGDWENIAKAFEVEPDVVKIVKVVHS